MTKYTVGIYFNEHLNQVALMLKNRPKWQAGFYNFPGGHVEENESEVECICREFKEECGVVTFSEEWTHVGTIRNGDCYEVSVFIAKKSPEHAEITTTEDQYVGWFWIDDLPDNCISNLYWLIPFALDFIRTGGEECLIPCNFNYEFKDQTVKKAK
ncbi:MAG: NUDIX hydrolase [Mangrovibacterium sp.]